MLKIKLFIDGIRKQHGFLSILSWIYPYSHKKSYSHLEAATEVSLARPVLLPPSYTRATQSNVLREPVTVTWQIHGRASRITTCQLPRFQLSTQSRTFHPPLSSCPRSSFPCNSFWQTMYRQQRGSGHIPQWPSAAADDATGINVGDGSNQDVCADLMNSTFPSFLHSLRNQSIQQPGWLCAGN